jgi:hypothetical protein
MKLPRTNNNSQLVWSWRRLRKLISVLQDDKMFCWVVITHNSAQVNLTALVCFVNLGSKVRYRFLFWFIVVYPLQSPNMEWLTGNILRVLIIAKRFLLEIYFNPLTLPYSKLEQKKRLYLLHPTRFQSWCESTIKMNLMSRYDILRLLKDLSSCIMILGLSSIYS